MKDKRTHRPRNENLKTESSIKPSQLELGKLVRLPYIRKISHQGQHPTSLDRPQNRALRNSHKQLALLEQTHMLTMQQIELCKDGSLEKDRFPKINPINPLIRRQHSIESLEYSLRNRDKKSLTKVDFLGDKLKEYRLGGVIAKGTYSVVRAATHNFTGKRVAIKTYLKSSLSNQDRVRNLQQQLQILSKLQHPLILQLHEHIATEHSVSIITQLLQNRSMSDYLKGQCYQAVSEEIAKFMVKQLVKAVAYCHANNVVHRDIKLENVLVSKDFKIKLIDFGFSVILPNESYILYDYCGTPNYIAPEVTQREGYYGKPADVWSLGVIIYRMVVGTFPPKVGSQSKGVKIPSELSGQLSLLLGQMLVYDFWKRPTAEEVLASDWLAR